MPDCGWVLIVDDDAANAEWLQGLPVNEGYTVRRHSRGHAALVVITASVPNIVLLSTDLVDTNRFSIHCVAMLRHGISR